MSPDEPRKAEEPKQPQSDEPKLVDPPGELTEDELEPVAGGLMSSGGTILSDTGSCVTT